MVKKIINMNYKELIKKEDKIREAIEERNISIELNKMINELCLVCFCKGIEFRK